MNSHIHLFQLGYLFAGKSLNKNILKVKLSSDPFMKNTDRKYSLWREETELRFSLADSRLRRSMFTSRYSSSVIQLMFSAETSINTEY